MAAKPRRSRYLRRGYLTNREEVRYETRGSKWYFFLGPVLATLFFAVGDYCYALAAGTALPSLAPLAAFLRTQGPDRVGLGWFTLLAIGLYFWCAERLGILREYRRRADRTGKPDQGEREPRLLRVPLAAFVGSLLGIYVFLALLVPRPWGMGPVDALAHRLGPVGLGGLLFGVLSFALLIWWAWRWGQWVQDSYVVTNDRLIKQHADWTWLGRVYDDREIQLHQVRDLDLYQAKLSWRILDIGTLNIHSLSDSGSAPAITRSGGYLVKPPDRVDPYLNPELPPEWAPVRGSVDALPGVEWWVAIPDPVRAQREIQDAADLAAAPQTTAVPR